MTIGISLANDSEKSLPLNITCVHLNYKDEYARLEEIEHIKKELDSVLPIENCQVWTGDFNSLTRKDYSKKEWETIANVREKNNWESPQIDLTKKVTIDVYEMEILKVFSKLLSI